MSAGGRESGLQAVVKIEDQIAQRLVAAELVDVPPTANAVGVAEAFVQSGARPGDVARKGVALVAVVRRG